MEEYSTVNFQDANVWHIILIMGVLFGSLLVANIIKTKVPYFKKSLVPNSVLGGLIVLVISAICYYTTGNYLFDLPMFSEHRTGMSLLEVVTYHCLAIGFIAMTLRPMQNKIDKKRYVEILNSGVLTIGGYMIQAIFGIAITAVTAALFIKDLAPASGVLLCFGYGQGTGQALNIGKNFDLTMGGSIYASFGLTLAAFGFLTASIVGVIYLNHLRRKGKILVMDEKQAENVYLHQIQEENETPMNESVDKMSIQLAMVLVAYSLGYGIMYLLGNVLLKGSSLTGTIYGFNFLFGVLAAVIVKGVLNLCKNAGVLKRQYMNSFLLNRISGFAFDLMIVAGICAIRIDLVAGYMGLLLLLGFVGAVITFYYVLFACKKLFPEYPYEQFLAFFGMLTGTASTGMILLREADPDLLTPVSENLVYENFPAMILAVPLLFIATYLTTNAASMQGALLMLGLIILIFIVLNLFLFRSLFFKKKGK